ncbi:MAG: hypothetical protein ABNH26_00890 [Celeribacter sp.]|jgi:hypothetical protein
MIKPFSIRDADHLGADVGPETSWGMTDAEQRRQDGALRDVMLASLRFGNLELDEIKVSQRLNRKISSEPFFQRLERLA